MELKLLTEAFSDNLAIWDNDEKLYVLNDDYFTKRTGINLSQELSGQNQVDAFLLSISHRLYNIIDSYANPEHRTHNVKVRRYLMERNHDLRKPIIDALVSFARAAIDTDIDRVGDEWTIDRRAQLLQVDNMDLPLDTRRILQAAGLISPVRYGFEVDL